MKLTDKQVMIAERFKAGVQLIVEIDKDEGTITLQANSIYRVYITKENDGKFTSHNLGYNKKYTLTDILKLGEQEVR